MDGWMDGWQSEERRAMARETLEGGTLAGGHRFWEKPVDRWGGWRERNSWPADTTGSAIKQLGG